MTLGPDLPELFRCERQGARLTVPACARMWRSARETRPAPWESRHHCLGCPVGAGNAGEKVETVALGAEEWRLVCCRCLRRAERLIHRKFCVSCFNRDREARIGRNAKGQTPRLVARLRPISIVVPQAGAVRTVTEARVLGAWEIMVAIARQATGPVAFGAAPGSLAAQPVQAQSAPD
ncbi:hypothetical protein EJV46_05865 [Roseococcus sp. SYP-B2431]|uniref:hypothetical protein n=1 Tax=Roseococcus sp. SYP-B2431 TaxID=2496640 RepID=UPI00103B8AC2|nr:hypothetical protein [Roseococcus sp. SYP-B2431]TCI00176.1 hypothetical protein EJV46_05865 [Roseococcus sp. SYP-B2431]